jgi:hypothetical protein
MVNVKKHEQTIIISDAENYSTVQLDLYGDVRIYFNLNYHDYVYSDKFEAGDNILIEIDSINDQELYEMLAPLFADQTSFTLSSENPFQKSRDNEKPSTVTFCQDEKRISIIFRKNNRQFADNVYLNEASANVAKVLDLYNYLIAYFEASGMRLERKNKEEVIDEN